MSVSAGILRTYVDYTAWASLLLLNAAVELPPQELTRDFQTADSSVLGTLAHIFAAGRLWLARLTAAPTGAFISNADRDLTALQSNWPVLPERRKSRAAELAGERARAHISYRDLEGRPRTRPLW